MQKLPQIPEQLQKAVADAASQSTRSLHQAVTRMGQCKKTLSELQGAWSTRLGAWEAYVTEVQESWKRNLADFQEEEESYLKKLADAEKELGVARKAVRDASKKASKEAETLSAEEAKELDDAISVDSEELMTDGAGTHSAWTAQTALNAFRVRGSSQKKRMEEFAEKLKVEQEEKKVKETLGRERSPRRRSKSPEIPVEGPEGEAEKVFLIRCGGHSTEQECGTNNTCEGFLQRNMLKGCTFSFSVMAWSHSVVGMEDFVCQQKAELQAIHLAFEMLEPHEYVQHHGHAAGERRKEHFLQRDQAGYMKQVRFGGVEWYGFDHSTETQLHAFSEKSLGEGTCGKSRLRPHCSQSGDRPDGTAGALRSKACNTGRSRKSEGSTKTVPGQPVGKRKADAMFRVLVFHEQGTAAFDCREQATLREVKAIVCEQQPALVDHVLIRADSVLPAAVPSHVEPVAFVLQKGFGPLVHRKIAVVCMEAPFIMQSVEVYRFDRGVDLLARLAVSYCHFFVEHDQQGYLFDELPFLDGMVLKIRPLWSQDDDNADALDVRACNKSRLCPSSSQTGDHRSGIEEPLSGLSGTTSRSSQSEGSLVPESQIGVGACGKSRSRPESSQAGDHISWTQKQRECTLRGKARSTGRSSKSEGATANKVELDLSAAVAPNSPRTCSAGPTEQVPAEWQALIGQHEEQEDDPGGENVEVEAEADRDQNGNDGPDQGGEEHGNEHEEAAMRVVILSYQLRSRAFLVTETAFAQHRGIMEDNIRRALFQDWAAEQPIPDDSFRWMGIQPQPDRTGDQIHALVWNEQALRPGRVQVLVHFKHGQALLKQKVFEIDGRLDREQLVAPLILDLDGRAEFVPAVEVICHGRHWPQHDLVPREVAHAALVILYFRREQPARSRSRTPPERPEVRRNQILNDPNAEHHQVDPRRMHVPGIQELSNSLHEPWTRKACDLWAGAVELPGDCVTMFAGAGSLSLDECDHIWIFSDGSSIWHQEQWRQIAGFGFVVAGWNVEQQQFCVLDHCYGPVSISDKDPAWKGASLATSAAAEIEALTWAGQWVLQADLRSDATVHLVSDYASGIYGTEGVWKWANIPVSNQWARHIWKDISSKFATHFLWVKGHNGMLWNEAADKLAGFAAETQTTNLGTVGTVLSDYKTALPWLWMVNAAGCDLPCFEADTLVFSGISQQSSPSFPKNAQQQKPTTSMSWGLLLATINVQTLQDKGDFHLAAGRTKVLMAQCEAKGFSVVGLQETRRSQNGAFPLGEYYVFGAACEKGQGGVELWFHMRRPWGFSSTGEVRFQPGEATVICAESRILIVRYHRMIFAALYAPHEMHTQEVRELFWNRVEHKLTGFRDLGFRIFLMCDANARLGSQVSGAVGKFAPEEQNQNGACLQHLACELSLTLPSTHEDFQIGPEAEAGTWCIKGSWKRIDYVAVSTEVINECTRAYVDTDFDMMHKKDDHRPACVFVGFTTCEKGEKVSGVSEVQALDGVELRNSERMSELVGIAAALQHHVGQAATWEMSADQHLHCITAEAKDQLLLRFRKKRAKPKPTWIPHDVWTLLREQKRSRRHGRNVRGHFQRGILGAVFYAWRRGRIEPADCSGWVKACQFRLAQLSCQQAQRYKKIQAGLKEARIAALEQHVSEQNLKVASSDGRVAWAAARRLIPALRKQKRAIPFAQVVDAAQQYFAEVEHGEEISLEQLQADVEQDNDIAQLSMAGKEVVCSDMPTIFDLEDAVRKLRTGKSYSMCQLPPELARASTSDFARMLWPVFLKFWIWKADPIWLKGGRVCPLYKGTGARQLVTSYRSICVTSVVTKCFQSILRDKVRISLQPCLGTLQIGGFPFMGTDFGSHALRALMATASGQKKPFAVIFLDLSNAFYSVHREGFCGDPLGIAEPDETRILSDLSTNDALSEYGLSEELRTLAQQVLHNSWFYVNSQGVDQPSAQVVRSQRGTRPGTPMADLAFTAVMGKAVEGVMQDCNQIHLNRGHGPIIWMDDVALMVESSSSQGLLVDTQVVLSSLARRMREKGLQINYKRNKTEILFHLAGSGANGCRRKIHFEDRDEVFSEQGGAVQAVHVVSSYKHLGTFQQASGGIWTDLKHRLGQAAGAWSAAQFKLFCSLQIPLKVRLHFFKALVFSRLFHKCETWPRLSVRHYKRLDAFVMKCYRGLAGMRHFAEQDERSTNRAVRRAIMQPCTAVILRQARLRYLRRLLVSGPNPLLVLLVQEDAACADGWWEQVRDDLRELQKFFKGKLERMPEPSCDLQPWIDFVKGSQGRWHSLLKQYVEKTVWHEVLMEDLQEWECGYRANLRRLRLPVEGIGGGEEHGEACRDRPFQCGTCAYRAASGWQLRLHESRKHGCYSLLRRYMFTGGFCHACLRDFHDRNRLRQHLQYRSDTCLYHLQATMWPLSGEDIREAEKMPPPQERPHRLPWRQHFGPLMPSRTEWEEAQIEPNPDRFPPRLLADTPDFPLGVQPAICSLDDSRDALLASPVCAESATCSLDVCHDALPEAAQRSTLEDVAQVRDGTPPRGMPGRDVFVLYLYSGRRREGDMSSWADHFNQASPAGRRVWVITLDIVYGAEGDLLDTAVRDRWSKHLRAGRICAVLVAPPCETWSRARWASVLEGDNGPKPLRCSEEPWGRRSVAVRHGRQLQVANRLLQEALAFMLLAIECQVVGLCEHPKEPPEPFLPSIWRLPHMRSLLQAKHTTRVLVHQHDYGAISAKPTHFFVANAKNTAAILQEEKLPVHLRRQKIVLRGRDAQGAWRNAGAKEYPPRLNKALLRLCLSQQTALRGESPEDAVFRFEASCFCRRAAATNAAMGPDFAV